jgi:N-acetyl-anhydromuramoyl-L-alanine amidase
VKDLAIRILASTHFNERPAGITIDTVVIHSMNNPLSECGDKFTVEACKACLDHHQVSAHYFIDREGQIVESVSPEKRAWHAGVSKLPCDGRENLNHSSIGIELIAEETGGMSDSQYQALAKLILSLADRFPLRHITGHSHVAPGRKTDPWEFDWQKLATLLSSRSFLFPS